MLVLEGLEGYGFKLRKRERTGEDLPREIRPKRKIISIFKFKPRKKEIYEPACKKRCEDILKECLTSCRV